MQFCSIHSLKHQHHLTDTLYRIVQTLDISVEEFLDISRLTHKELLRILDKKNQLPLSSLVSLCQHLNVSMENLITGSIDYEILRRQFRSKNSELPDHYRGSGSFSRKRTSMNVLRYLEDQQSWAFKHRILRSLQVKENSFVEPNDWISVRFLTDLCNKLKDLGTNDSTFYQMGQYTIQTNYDSPLGRFYRSLKHPKAVTQACIEEYVHYYDLNFSYALEHLSADLAVIVAKPSSDVLDSLKTKTIGSSSYCMTKSGAFSAFPEFLDLPAAQVHEPLCVHRGDQQCRYEIDFSYANYLLKKKNSKSASSSNVTTTGPASVDGVRTN